MGQHENCRQVEVRGQVTGVQMNRPDEGGGGTFQLLLENGDIIVSPYPAEWHLEVGGAFQANDVRRAIVSGIGEYSPDGKLQRIGRDRILWHSLGGRMASCFPPPYETAGRRMSDFFGDASYWIALIDVDDEFHEPAMQYATLLELENTQIVTTELALNEVLSPQSGTTSQQRQAAINLIDRIRQNPQVAIVPQTPEQFDEALNLLRARTHDKEWSITTAPAFW